MPFKLDGYILHSEKPVELVHLLLKPGEKLESHKNPFDVVFFVIEGSGLLTINDEKKQLKSSDTIKVTSEHLRSWENNTQAILRLLVIKLI
ncbi:MAG: cupin domain-containing protein [Marinilabiliales bacterium]|nr:cupin domain-containing protein [Marinilabiliales bacterium]